ncbi:MAG: tetratricopeptide repeat protein [Planctomycetes bacterium]|nr:tetratricopeptide repeat protein [Planctomycetota bacterium]
MFAQGSSSVPRALLAAALIAGCGAPRALLAQDEVARQLGLARAALEQDDPEAAVRALQRALDLRPQDPELHWRLGQALALRGDTAGALAAWKRTLELAPGHRRAASLIEALEGSLLEVAQRLVLIEELALAGLDERAGEELERLRAAHALSGANLQRALELRLALLARGSEGQAAEVLAGLRELELRFPVAPEEPRRELLVARALVAAERREEGLRRLDVLARGSGEIAAESALELLLLRRDGSGSRAEELEAWTAAHAAHPRVEEALRAALEERIASAQRLSVLAPEAPLGAPERAVIELALRLVRADALPSANQRVLQRVTKFLERREGARPSEARGEGLELLVAAPWSPAQRGALRVELAERRSARACAEIARLAESGELARFTGEAAELAVLNAALSAWRALRDEMPGAPDDRAALAVAQALVEAAKALPWPAERRALLAPDRWALALGAELLGGPQAEVAKAARGLLLGILERAASRDLEAASALAEELFGRVSAFDALRTELRRLSVLWRLASLEQSTEPSSRDERAQRLAALLAAEAERAPSAASALLPRVGEALAKLLAGARDVDAAEWLRIWSEIARALPGTLRFELELRRSHARIDRALDLARSAQSAGLSFAALLEELHTLVAELDALQGGLAPEDPRGAPCEAERVRFFAAFDALDAPSDHALELLADGPGLRPHVVAHRALLRFDLLLARAHRALSTELARVPRAEAAPRSILRVLEQHAMLAAGADRDLQARHEALLSLGAQLAQSEALSWSLAVFAAVENAARGNDELAARARFASAGARRAAGFAQRSGGASKDPALGALLEAALEDYAVILARWPRTSTASSSLRSAYQLALDLARAGAYPAARSALLRIAEQAPALHEDDALRCAMAIAEVGELLQEAAFPLLERAIGAPQAPATSEPMLGAAPLDLLEAVPEAEGRLADTSADAFYLSLGVPRQTEQRMIALERAMANALAQRAARAQAEAITQTGATAASIEELPAAEIARRVERFEAARAALQSGIDGGFSLATAEIARGVFDAIAAHWTRFGLHERAAVFLAQVAEIDLAHPRRSELRLDAALALLQHAASGASRAKDAAARAELERRYQAGRDALGQLASEEGYSQALRDRAVVAAAQSFLAQARALDAHLGSRARGPYVRAARELARAESLHPMNAALGAVSAELLSLGDELATRGLSDAAVEIWRVIVEQYPTRGSSREAASRIAQSYAGALDRPLAAVDAFLELHHLFGGANPEPASQILALAARLQAQRRWVEALHALEVFVEGFPSHPEIASALERIGAVHSENGAWNEALAAYRRVIQEHEGTPVAHEARWATARAWIHLSRWTQAEDAYRVWLENGGEEARRADAERRRVVLKDLARHQGLVDEEGQRKAFDAQFQIARIVAEQLGEIGKAIDEYEKVAQRWPESHLADDALYQVGLLRFQRGETEEGRGALLRLAERYPSSPASDDALFAVGQSFEREADALAEVTRASSLVQANEVAQKRAYRMVADNRRDQLERSAQRLAEAKKISKDEADRESAFLALQTCNFDFANTQNAASWVSQQIEVLSAEQLADRQDRIHAALRRAVGAFGRAAQVASGDKADQALLELARIQDARLGDAEAALRTWSAIATQYAGTAVAEDASWRLAEAYQRRGRHAEAIEAYGAFLRNYRRSARAEAAQIAMAEGLENLGRWIEAMDAYQRYLESFPEGGSAARAREQIAWIKTYRL